MYEMTLKIIFLDGTEYIYDCTNFEFRSNTISNWIKIYTKKYTLTFENVAMVKTVSKTESAPTVIETDRNEEE